MIQQFDELDGMSDAEFSEWIEECGLRFGAALADQVKLIAGDVDDVDLQERGIRHQVGKFLANFEGSDFPSEVADGFARSIRVGMRSRFLELAISAATARSVQ